MESGRGGRLVPLIDLIIIPIAFVMTVGLGKLLIPYVKRLRIGQTVRDDGPESHFAKTGTPTMGAIMFIVPTLLLGIYFSFRASSWVVLIMLALTLAMAAIGFLDDYIKVRISKEGLSPKQKSIPMLIACTLFVLYYLYFYGSNPEIVWPFALGITPITGAWKIVYGIFLVIFMYFTINAVNITDGVDGLLSTLSIPVFFSLAYAASAGARAYSTGNTVSLAFLALIGGLLGFLVYNRHPAKIFMGDTGSLAIGALFSSFLVLTGTPWLLLLTGFVYCAEAMSVVIQVLYFKATHGKRIFRMSPIHHHFELGGWSENKVVVVFSAIALLGSVIGLLALGIWS